MVEKGQVKREMLGSRLGFLLLSAGCAIGLGNVWRFPYITGAYGGAIFVGIYIFFLRDSDSVDGCERSAGSPGV